MEILNIDESHELERCEVVIKQGLQTFIEVGQALRTIREKRLYRISFKTFEDYCVGRWAFKKSQAYQLIDASVVISNLSAIAEILPKTESQTRPLTRLEPEIQKEVWKEVVKTHGDNITNFHAMKWAKDNNRFQQIDRWSDWGNPFIISGDGDRDTVCESFKIYFNLKLELKSKVKQLKGKALGCHCYPLRCHGEHLKQLADGE
jgi:hypothetical protein